MQQSNSATKTVTRGAAKGTTFVFPVEISEALRERAHRDRVPKVRVVCEALRYHLGLNKSVR